MYHSLLIVESDLDQLDVLSRWFSRAGYHVTAAHHPRQAIAATTLHPFQVALINQELPEISGSELTRRLQSLLPDVQVIAFTTNADDEELATSEGTLTCVRLPCPKATLEAAVEDAFERYSKNLVESPTTELSIVG